MMRALDQARQACGGHGFLHSSRLNELRDSFDPSQTFEGENHMILQQTSNILLDWARTGRSGTTPMNTFEMLNTKEHERFKNFGKDIIDDVLHAYRWLIVYYLNETKRSFDELMKENGNNTFDARNRSQARTGRSGTTPMNTFEMLNAKEHERFKNFGKDIIDDVLHAYRWLIVYYLNETKRSFDELMKENGNNTFDARNRSQVHKAQMLGIAYAEHTAIQWAADIYRQLDNPQISQVINSPNSIFTYFYHKKRIHLCFIAFLSGYAIH
ncbi:unnamed protein product [Strongylus vulgaris]|uniref:Uncharacterized protein n=1 Tax=Strongylus vulgaris TaxID=40348 RepID=A0A3P7JHG4_STRVU|nr:unnamed protein product [Strongylus vulgaris]